MANNLFVAYDLDKPGQNYDAIEKAIKALGTSVKVQMSLYYVKTVLTCEQAEKRLWESMDANDRLLVVEASNAWWHNPIPPSSEVIQANWTR